MQSFIRAASPHPPPGIVPHVHVVRILDTRLDQGADAGAARPGSRFGEASTARQNGQLRRRRAARARHGVGRAGWSTSTTESDRSRTTTTEWTTTTTSDDTTR